MYTMNHDLRVELVDAIKAEAEAGGDLEFRDLALTALAKIMDGDLVPEPTEDQIDKISNSDHAEDLELTWPVWSSIAFFGIGHLAEPTG